VFDVLRSCGVMDGLIDRKLLAIVSGLHNYRTSKI
jgi:hypothetical protein